MSTSLVFPVRYVSEGVAVQTTSRELSALGIAVRSLSPPKVGARVSMALYLPNTAIPEVAVGRVSRAENVNPGEAGFWADFLVVDPHPRMRISSLLSDRDVRDSPNHRSFDRVPVLLEVPLRTAGDFPVERASYLRPRGTLIHTNDPPPVNVAEEMEKHL